MCNRIQISVIHLDNPHYNSCSLVVKRCGRNHWVSFCYYEQSSSLPSTATIRVLPFPLLLRAKFFNFPAHLRAKFFHFPANLRARSTTFSIFHLWMLISFFLNEKWKKYSEGNFIFCPSEVMHQKYV